jgi:response regulator RpfG family c-di-GMP phosphodiesterase
MSDSARPRILFVDDEVAVLDALALQMRRRYTVVTMNSGPAALRLLQSDRAFAVVVSDLNMPEMDGATFLGWARQFLPEAVRVLLTGATDLEAAVNAVNEGQIFRFLRKPCSPASLLACLDAAAEQHRLVTAERRLLEETFNGSIRALTDVLAVTNPASFGRATRVRNSASAMAKSVGLEDVWKVEVAAMLSQLGCITLPPETIERLHAGQTLTAHEKAMVARVPTVTEGLLGKIPRLEDVCALITRAALPLRRTFAGSGDPKQEALFRGAQVLRLAQEFDVLEARGATPEAALNALRARDDYEADVLDALAALKCNRVVREEVREMPILDLRAGMVLAEELRMSNGTLLAADGYEVSAGFVERVRNFRPGTVKERVLVRVAFELAGLAAAAPTADQPSASSS